MRAITSLLSLWLVCVRAVRDNESSSKRPRQDFEQQSRLSRLTQPQPPHSISWGPGESYRAPRDVDSNVFRSTGANYEPTITIGLPNEGMPLPGDAQGTLPHDAGPRHIFHAERLAHRGNHFIHVHDHQSTIVTASTAETVALCVLERQDKLDNYEELRSILLRFKEFAQEHGALNYPSVVRYFVPHLRLFAGTEKWRMAHVSAVELRRNLVYAVLGHTRDNRRIREYEYKSAFPWLYVLKREGSKPAQLHSVPPLY